MRLRVLVPATVVALLVASCGSGGDEETSDMTGYEVAVSGVDPGTAQDSFEWVDGSRLSELAGEDVEELGDPSGRFSAVTTIGTGPLANVAGQGEAVYGFDPIGVPASVSVGLPPDQATRFDGVDVAHVPA